ncbi:MAG TPA: hypothetical protein VKZ58_08925 [Longimicrobiales bacterium]|nr:hypothetical protein [Longimicrobiales bacterium]
MKLPPPPELAAMPVHAVVRDFPETLGVFLRFGVDLPGRGGGPVSAALDGDTGPLLDALLAATAWRESECASRS